MRRHHAIFFALVAAAVLGTSAVFTNDWLQRRWLEGKWGHRTSLGITSLGISAAVAVLACAALALSWRNRRWASTSYAPLRWALPILLAAWITTWTFDSPHVRYDAHVAIAGAAAAWCAAVALRAPWPGEPRRWARVLDLATFEIALCAFAAEVALRGVRRATESKLLATGGTDVDAWIRAHRLEPGTLHLGYPVNADGFVDVEPSEAAAHRPLVACIGDSFSVAVVPHHQNYMTVAEGEFDGGESGGLEVYNVGIANAGPREYLRMLERFALPLRPDLIVVGFFLGNDVLDARFDIHDEPLAIWMDKSEVLILQFPLRILNLARERRAQATGDGMVLDAFGVPSTLRLSPREVEQRLPWLLDPMLEVPAFSSERFYYIQSSRAAMTYPRNRSLYKIALADLGRMRAAAGSIPFAVLLIPDELQVEDAQWEYLRKRLDKDADRELPQRIVGEWLDEHEIPYIDLYPRLRAVPKLPDGKLHVYHLQDTHLNARGNQVAGKALAELIERCGVARRKGSK